MNFQSINTFKKIWYSKINHALSQQKGFKGMDWMNEWTNVNRTILINYFSARASLRQSVCKRQHTHNEPKQTAHCYIETA
jgi:hypothetical protein